MKEKLKRHYYLLHLQFLGFRFSGWQKQTNAKTIQGMVDKTLFCILEHDNFKTLGAGRTDAMVSANHFVCELFIFNELDINFLYEELSKQLPPDIKVLKVEEVDENFEIITGAKIKEYMYLFSYGKEKYPLSAPYMVNIGDNLDIELMKEGAKLFTGTHNFKSYCYRPNPHGEFMREILVSKIVQNNLLKANFFPKVSFIFHVHAKGFMRHQIRLMIGTLFRLGAHEISLQDISLSLIHGDNERLGFVAPSSGLILNKTLFASNL